MENGRDNSEGEPSVLLQIDVQENKGGDATPEHSAGGGGGSSNNLRSNKWGYTWFEPTREITDEMEQNDANTGGGGSSFQSNNRPSINAPEKKLTLFALRLAILEKAASGIGALGFIWATVVLLGGFAITLHKVDFWVVTTILVIEGARIFSRSHELEWQHQALTDTGRHGFRALSRSLQSSLFKHEYQQGRRSLTISDKSDNQETNHNPVRRTWHSSEVPFLPYAGWIFLSKNISMLLYWLQLLSAAASVTLSLMRITNHDFGIDKGDKEKRNLKSALMIFYSLALAEALLFFMERAYWEWKLSLCKLLEEVSRECELDHSGVASIKRFFYDAYSKCINGSIFDGLKMDLVCYAVELLASELREEQLIGARILRKFATNVRFSDDTLRKLGTSTLVMERLIEMLNWKNSSEEEMRMSAAEIISKLAGKKQNALRVAGIPGSMESISSLLYTGPAADGKPHEIHGRGIESFEYSAFNLLGIRMLKRLAHDHDNCGKIGSTRGLLSKIIDFTSTEDRLRLLSDDRVTDSQIKTVKRSLQLVKMLVSTTGHTGRTLRQEISENVFTISNMKDILRFGNNHMMLQKLAIEILTSLAMEEEGREKIGRTGGIIRELFRIFFTQGLTENENSVIGEAGEALAMLALESKGNCFKMLRLDVMERLVAAVGDPLLGINAARILRNLCAYSGTECLQSLKEVVSAIPTVLRAIMEREEKLLEVSVGLAAQIFKFAKPEEAAEWFEVAGIKESELAQKLVTILGKYDQPSVKVPRMRRFVIELVILMVKDEKNVKIFKDVGMKAELERLAETTSELECFNVFSGSAGLSRNHATIYSLSDTALEMLADGQQ